MSPAKYIHSLEITEKDAKRFLLIARVMGETDRRCTINCIKERYDRLKPEIDKMIEECGEEKENL